MKEKIENYRNNVKVSKNLCTFPWQSQKRKHSLVVNTIVSENKSASRKTDVDRAGLHD